MNREEKVELVNTLQSTFGAASSVVVAHQVGLTVAESSELRQKMRDAGAAFKVTKNRIAKIAVQGTKDEALLICSQVQQQLVHLMILWQRQKHSSSSPKAMTR